MKLEYGELNIVCGSLALQKLEPGIYICFSRQRCDSSLPSATVSFPADDKVQTMGDAVVGNHPKRYACVPLVILVRLQRISRDIFFLDESGRYQYLTSSSNVLECSNAPIKDSGF